MTTTTAQVFTYRAMGFTDDVTTCEICGKPELKGTVRLVITDQDGSEGGEVYAGVVCAARRAGRKAAEIRTEAQRADRARIDAMRATFRAWQDVHHEWFMARRTAVLGPNPSTRDILTWTDTPEFKAEEAAWSAANPRPDYPVYR